MISGVRRLAACLAASVIVFTATACQPAVVAVATVHAGMTPADAAPSCWAIKQSFPTSPDGVYWLLTPQLGAPQQFACDMTTDGGGWVLIGRGREGWRFNATGQGTPATLRTSISGPAAFTPHALSTTTIDSLLGGGRSDALVDGIRVRRATDSLGTAWQEVRYHLADQTGWSWAFGGGIRLQSIEFDGVNFALPNSNALAASTADTAIDDAWQRIFTWPWFGHNSQAGFAFGAAVAGTSNPTDHLWAAAGENYAIPFAQVWLRPQISDATAGFIAIPDGGAPQQPRAALLNDTPQTMPWGVAGVLKPADPDPNNDAPVLALAQIGSTVYVGGKFQDVRNASGSTSTTQSFLAAFDMTTRAWINTFRPTLDGAVFDLAATPNGRLIVAGNFTNVNGVANTAGLAMLDATSGNAVSGWRAPVSSKRFAGSRPWIRAIDVQNNFVYLAGSFNKVSGGTPLAQVTAGGIARVALSDGRPDTSWKATVDGTPMDIDASADGAQVTIVGRFATVNGVTQRAVALLDPTDASLLTGRGAYVPNDQAVSNQWMQTVLDLHDTLVVGGSQHSLQQYQRDTMTLSRAHSARYGGDFQALTVLDGVLYASCHCGNWTYSDTNHYPIDRDYSRVTPLSWAVALDPTTFDVIEGWEPQINPSTQYEGPWRFLGDSAHCLWVAGDLTSTWRGAWLGGFARFCAADSSPPPTPTGFTYSARRLKWRATIDANGVESTYEVLRDDRVIAALTGRFLLTREPGRYFGRSVDAAGNRSATTPVQVVT